jgi:8-oxo-dGTP pyrophosphatase MutT (NUDIX family)
MSSPTGPNHHPDILNLQHNLRAAENQSSSTAIDPSAREAAVALILRTLPEKTLELLMIQRAEFEGDPWSGNIALPGGRREPGEVSLKDTVIREVREETAIDLAVDGTFLGLLRTVQPLSQTVPPLIVVPYVVHVKPDAEIVPNHEVARAFWVPLDALRQADRWQQTVMTIRGKSRQLSCFRYEDHVIWGMTERILRNFIQFLPKAS